jgi:exopolysaccharide production protein ExoZ
MKQWNAIRQWAIAQLEISHGAHSPLRPMEGLRGLAVFLVFLVHYTSLIEPWNNSASGFPEFIGHVGNLGVDLFFILSGFLIYGTIITKDYFQFGDYAKRRIVRIYPTFLVVFSIYIALSFVFPNESKIPSESGDAVIYIIQNLLLLPGLLDVNPILTVAWSLSYEVFYYLLIPLLALAFSMKKWSSNLRIAVWITVSVVGFYLAYLYGGHVRLLMFVAGIILFECYKIKNIKLKWLGTSSFILALLLYGFRDVLNINAIASFMIVFVLFFIFCLSAFTPNSRSSKWLTYSPLRWLGNMSYSYYLIHGLVLKALFIILPVIMPPSDYGLLMYFVLLAPFFIITMMGSFVLFVVVERPLSIEKKSIFSTRNAQDCNAQSK